MNQTFSSHLIDLGEIAPFLPEFCYFNGPSHLYVLKVPVLPAGHLYLHGIALTAKTVLFCSAARHAVHGAAASGTLLHHGHWYTQATANGTASLFLLQSVKVCAPVR